jgi:hypothetical protein
MTTRLQLRTSLRSVLTDSAQFRDSQLNQWIDDGINDYSINFPYRMVATIPVGAGARWYLLNDYDADVSGILEVEYPYGLEPRRILTWLEERHPGFLGGPYYDYYTYGVDIAGTHVEQKYLVLGEEPAEGEAINVIYARPRARPASDISVITVPDQHLEVLRLYVYWRAALALEVDESISIMRKEAIISRLGLSADRLGEIYQKRLKEISHVSSLHAAWRADAEDRIY